MTSTIRFIGLVLAVGLIPLVAAAELAKWDQARVTKYATELSTSCDELSEAVRKERAGVNISQQNAQHQAQEAVKVLCKTSRQLMVNLEAGQGRDETMGIYMKLPTQRRDAEEAGRRALITESAMDKIFAVGGPLMRLRPYYEEEPPAGE